MGRTRPRPALAFLVRSAVKSGDTMKAVVCTSYGPPEVLQLREVKSFGADGSLKLDSGRLAVLNDLVEAGHVKPVIDRCYPLEKIVEAHSYVGGGHKKGGVAITI
jgi:hypothetical protein